MSLQLPIILLLILSPLVQNTDSSNMQGERITLYDHIQRAGQNSRPTLVIDTDFGRLIGKNKLKEEYQEGTFHLMDDDLLSTPMPIEIKTRGNTRKKVCRLPPLKLNFSKKALSEMGLRKKDKLKLVLPCKSRESSEVGLYREYMIYQLYDVIDPTNAVEAVIVDLIIRDEGKDKDQYMGILVEDEDHYQDRTGNKLLPKARINDESFDRVNYVRVMFFQYMILNTDFGIENKHNIEVCAPEGAKKPIIVPYDFDYAGMVNQPYAVPFEAFHINDVREPYFRGKFVTMEEMREVHDFYLTKEQELRDVIEEDQILPDTWKKRMLGDIDRFYKELREEKRWKRRFIDKK